MSAPHQPNPNAPHAGKGSRLGFHSPLNANLELARSTPFEPSSVVGRWRRAPFNGVRVVPQVGELVRRRGSKVEHESLVERLLGVVEQDTLSEFLASCQRSAPSPGRRGHSPSRQRQRSGPHSLHPLQQSPAGTSPPGPVPRTHPRRPRFCLARLRPRGRRRGRRRVLTRRGKGRRRRGRLRGGRGGGSGLRGGTGWGRRLLGAAQWGKKRSGDSPTEKRASERRRREQPRTRPGTLSTTSSRQGKLSSVGRVRVHADESG